uniref:non-specific serine/threonine protein kinase n=1 Tax=Babesia bovis TaxID=5865 RepID=A7ARL5_BABBO|eukprot:XP_001610752.1 protein kinase domain containing protein [Babesia bovis T2Bo]
MERALCLNEIKLIANINHPFIVKYLGSYLEGYVLYILTQYCKDLKSLNILIDADKSIKLCDFGVSKALNTTAEHTRTVIGTPYYFSPELINGNEYNWPSDIWALGCLTYELATFRTPFDGAKGMQQLVKSIKTEPIPNLPEIYSHELNTLFKSMMFHDVRFRLSASELLSTDIMQMALRRMLKEAERNCTIHSQEKPHDGSKNNEYLETMHNGYEPVRSDSAITG